MESTTNTNTMSKESTANKEVILPFLQAYEYLNVIGVYGLGDEDVKFLYEKIDSLRSRIMHYVKYDKYDTETIVRELTRYLDVAHCAELKEIRESKGMAILHCRAGLDITFDVSISDVFIQGVYNSRTDRRQVPREMNRTISNAILAIDEMIRELIKD